MEQAGIDLLHIPYKGGGEAVASVLSGTTDSYFSVPIECGPAHQGRQARGARRLRPEAHAVFPEVPTIAESGLPELRHAALHVDARSRRHAAGHPAKLSENIVKAMQAPDVREKLAQNGDIALGTLAEASTCTRRSTSAGRASCRRPASSRRNDVRHDARFAISTSTIRARGRRRSLGSKDSAQKLALSAEELDAIEALLARTRTSGRSR